MLKCSRLLMYSIADHIPKILVAWLSYQYPEFTSRAQMYRSVVLVPYGLHAGSGSVIHEVLTLYMTAKSFTFPETISGGLHISLMTGKPGHCTEASLSMMVQKVNLERALVSLEFKALFSFWIVL